MGFVGRSLPFLFLSTFVGGLVSLSFSDEAARFARTAPSFAKDELPQSGNEANAGAGSYSCSAASCHGGGQTGKWGSEFTTWIERDPHSHAHRVLFNVASQNMIRRMRSGSLTDIKAAPENALCLKCHAPGTGNSETVARMSDKIARPVASVGVSCESCHGESSQYLTVHYQPDRLNQSTKEKAEKSGLLRLTDLSWRVKQCASCHIGNKDQEVNHDLIAAGHPRLQFEYTSFHNHREYLPHWRETNYGDDFEVRAWAIGQVATARAAIELLRVRANQAAVDLASKDAKLKTPWRELSQFSCHACHKSLDPSRESWTLHLKTDRPPGVMPWGGSTIPLLPLLAKQERLSGTGGEPSLAALRQLRTMMNKQQIEPKALAQQTEEALRELDGWLARMQKTAESESKSQPITTMEIARLFRDVAAFAIVEDGPTAVLNDLDVDGVALVYQSLCALERAYRRQSRTTPPRELSDRLAALRYHVGFPCGYNSPRDAKPSEIIKLLLQLRNTPLHSEPRP